MPQVPASPGDGRPSFCGSVDGFVSGMNAKTIASDIRPTHQAGGITEPLVNDPDYRGAKRSPNPRDGTGEPLRQVESAGPVCEVRNDERRQYAQRGSAEPVQQLHDDEHHRVCVIW